MHILAIETTDLSGSAALLDGDRVLQTCELPTQPRSAATLAPAIHDLLAAAHWSPSDVQLICVATGPGSFTGLRVGVVTAKVFAYATGAQVIGVNTLQVIARQAPPNVDRLWTVVDAQRQQLFGCRWRGNSQRQWQAIEPPSIYDDAQWLADLAQGDVVSGPGLAKLKSRLPDTVRTVDESLWRPRAEFVGLLGRELYQQGQRDDVWSLAPQYFRLSAAEEKLRQSAPKT